MASDITIEDLARRIAGVDYVAEQDRLRDIFRMAQLLILDSVERLVRTRPDRVPEQMMALLTDVTRRYRQATLAAQKWTNLQTKRAFDAGRKAAAEQLELQGVRGTALATSFTQVNRGAVEAIAKDTMGDLLRATHLTEESVKQRVRQVFLEETRSMVATGVRGSDRAKEIAKRFADEQIFGVTARNGRFIPMEEYARVVANVKLRQAHTEGTERMVLDSGKDLVRVTTHPHRPDSCSPLEGKVYSLTGRTPGYPRLEKHTPFHPGCRHVETVYVESGTDEEIDRVKRDSNTPGQITVYSQDVLDALEVNQKKRARFTRAKRELRKQDQAAIVSGKKDAPKDAASYERSLTARANAKVRKMGPLASSSSGMRGYGADRPRHDDLEVVQFTHGEHTITISGAWRGTNEARNVEECVKTLKAEYLQGLTGIEFVDGGLKGPDRRPANATYNQIAKKISIGRDGDYDWRTSDLLERVSVRRTGLHEIGHHVYNGGMVSAEEIAVWKALHGDMKPEDMQEAWAYDFGHLVTAPDGSDLSNFFQRFRR